ncbi:hypothetical protein LSAT2_015512, partial [Lamellibrachia satsuma]
SARGPHKCFATVSQRGDAFVRGKHHGHNHLGGPGALLRCKVTKMVSFILIPDPHSQCNITEDGERHLVFATPTQLSHLTRSRLWFLDRTFRVVLEPFQQLVSNHSFIRARDA